MDNLEFKDVILPFIRRKDYKYIGELGNGSFGKTVLMQDEITKELYACKKYAPAFEAKTKYFDKFIEEIKILNSMLHENIVRFYNSYLYPEEKVGFIIMEYIDGENNSIDKYIIQNTSRVEEIFEQTINGFKYIESKKICHRDIRFKNILVNTKGIVKIIDFGFGREFDLYNNLRESSITDINWIAPLPFEMVLKEPLYDNKTDIYFLGNLFKMLLSQNDIKFKYTYIIEKMCQYNPIDRYKSFYDIHKQINEKELEDIVIIKEKERELYLYLANNITNLITSISEKSIIETNIDNILPKLIQAYTENSLEENIQNNRLFIDCFIIGEYECKDFENVYNSYEEEFVGINNINVKKFAEIINWLKSCNNKQRQTISKNLKNRFNKIPKYKEWDEELPF